MAEPVSDLPAEIWLAIFRSATHVPDTMQYPELVQLPDGGILLSTFARERYELSLSTKRRLVGVCRQWYALVVPWLYEHISVTSPAQLESVVNAAAHAPAIRSPDDSTNLGWFIKRLDLLVPELKWELQSADQDPPTYSLAPQLCKLSPNLITLNTASQRDGCSFPLSDVLSPRLEYLYLMNYFRMDIPHWVTFLDLHPRLSSIHPPYFTPQSSSSPMQVLPWADKSWPSVRELVFHDSSQPRIYATQFPSGAFPSLQKLVLTYSSAHRGLDEFLSTHGKNLITFRFCSGGIGYAMLQIVHTHCPKLQELMPTFNNLLIADVGVWPWRPNLMHGITVLGLQFYQEDDECVKFCRTSQTWVSLLPSLRTIRIFEEQNALYLTKHPSAVGEFAKFLSDCASRRISVEDNFGRPLDQRINF